MLYVQYDSTVSGFISSLHLENVSLVRASFEGLDRRGITGRYSYRIVEYEIISSSFECGQVSSFRRVKDQDGVSVDESENVGYVSSSRRRVSWYSDAVTRDSMCSVFETWKLYDVVRFELASYCFRFIASYSDVWGRSGDEQNSQGIDIGTYPSNRESLQQYICSTSQYNV